VSIKDKLTIDGALEKYGLPKWIKPYAYSYIKSDPIGALKRARSFLDVGRKKGEVTGKYVKLPNGMILEKYMVEHLLTLFYYSEERMSEISNKWSEERSAEGSEYAKYFSSHSVEEAKKARALKNLMEGLGLKLGEPPSEVGDVFDYLGSIEDWRQRIIAKEVVLRDSYAKTFGFVFYKAFYPVSPEFMRMLVKVFEKSEEMRLDQAEIKRIISEIDSNDKMIRMTEELLARIYQSIEANMPMAKKAKLEKEVALLRDISIAYPLHTFEDLGVEIDIKSEIKNIVNRSKDLD
jgi:hypothetical protein